MVEVARSFDVSDDDTLVMRQDYLEAVIHEARDLVATGEPHDESKVKVAAVQAAPVFLDLEGSLQKAEGLIEGGREARAWSCSPRRSCPPGRLGCDEVLPGEDAAWYLRLLEQSVVVPARRPGAWADPARAAEVQLVMGINEREEHGGTLYDPLHFDPRGPAARRRRKLVPTHAERLVWGIGGEQISRSTRPLGQEWAV